ncbi:MAG: hypothetical protein ABSB38_09715 [Dehalococcoidia bacterium]
MSVYEVVHVAVGLSTVLDEELVKKVSEIIGKNPYETRLRLTGKIPKIIANYDAMQQAELTTKSLRELGLVVILFTDSELRKPWQIFKARNLKFEEQAIMFCDRSGQTRRMEASEAFLILSGRVQTYTETESTKTTRKLNVTATLLTGGIPIMKKVEKKTTSKSFQTKSFLRLYDCMSPELAVEILQDDFDYSFLGTEMVSSATANFSIAIRKIREAFPQAIFDDSLIEPFGANMPDTIVQDSIESNCKLLYWYHQAVNNVGTSIQTQLG